MIRSLKIWLAAWSVLAAALASQGYALSAQAQDAKRVAILDFTGPSASAVQGQVSQGLAARDEVELVTASEVQSATDRLGHALESPADYKEVGGALELSAFVEGTVVKEGRNLQATVRVRDASTGQVTHEETWSRRRSGVKTIRPQVWDALGTAITDSSAAPKPKPVKAKPKPVVEPVEEEEEPPRVSSRHVDQDEEEEEEEEEEEDEQPKRKSEPGNKSASHPALVVQFGPSIMWRTLKYEGDTNLTSYTSTDEGSPAFTLALGAQYYPGAHVSNAWYSDLGLDFLLDYAIGLKSKQDGKEYSTTAYDLGIGAIYRLRLGDFEPRFRVGYNKQVFDTGVPLTTTTSAGTVAMSRTPAVDYSAIRLGVGSAINLVDWLSFDVSFAYLPVLSTGQLDDEDFGDTPSTRAWEAGGGVLVRFKEVYGARIALDYRRYKYDFGLSDNASASMLQLPKSGTDSYLWLTIAFLYNLPGQK